MKTPLLLRRLNIATAVGLVVLSAGVSSTAIFASGTANLAQTITAGSLSVDFVNASYVTIGSPAVTMSSKPFSFACQSGGGASTGALTTSTQLLYVKNPDAADGGWTVSLAAANTTNTWTGAIKDYDFNDPAGSGCTDTTGGSDADAFGGQMTVTPTGATLAVGSCLTCGTTGVSLGSAGTYIEGTTDSVTLLTGSAGSDDIGDWKVSDGIAISQTIPAEQPADSTYDINMVLSII